MPVGGPAAQQAAELRISEALEDMYLLVRLVSFACILVQRLSVRCHVAAGLLRMSTQQSAPVYHAVSIQMKRSLELPAASSIASMQAAGGLSIPRVDKLSKLGGNMFYEPSHL